MPRRCEHVETEVIETRNQMETHINGSQYNVVRRRRRCKKCDARWYTFEIMDNEYKALTRVKEMIQEGRDAWGLRKN